MKLRFLLSLLCVFVALPAWAAETTGFLKGVVNDTEGLAVPGVLVTLSAEEMLGDRQVETGADGAFRFSQLPVGSYKLMAAKAKFNTWSVDGVRVTMGATATVQVVMDVAIAGAEIVVESEHGAVDVERVRTGTTLSAAKLKDLPSEGRDYQSAISFAPGVVGSGNANMHGGMDSQNQFYVDGVNITDPMTNTFSMNMNYDAIEEVEVITGGMDAEYGRSLGGAVNIVTKSGGNEFEGMASAYYSDERFRVYEPMDFDDPESEDYTEQQFALNLGGPILKDKVWFFASTQLDVYRDRVVFDNDVVGRPSGDDPITPWADEMSEVAPRDWRSRYIFGKITAQPNPQHRVWVHAQADPTAIKNVEQSPYTLPSGESVQNQGGWLGSVGHIWMPNDNFNLETQLYAQQSWIEYYSILWDECENFDAIGACLDDFGQGWWGADADGFNVGEIPYSVFTQRSRRSFNTAATWYTTFLGQHRFKAGLQFEQLESYSVYPGLDGDGMDYWTHAGDPADLTGYSPSFTYRYESNLESTLTGTMTSAYLQDVWQPLPNLTLRPGVRLDAPTLKNDVGETVFSAAVFAPRMGLAWDVKGDNRTNLHAYYGRFTDPGFLYIADLLMSRSQGWALYYWDDETDAWDTEASMSSASTFLAHTDLKPPVSDEWNLGLTQAMSDNFAFDVTWIHKFARGFWEDDEVNQIWNEEGTDVIGTRNGVNEAIYRLRTSDTRYTKFDALEFSVNGDFENWWLAGSYTWSKAVGTNDDQVATMLMDVTPQIQYEDGYLSYDRTHAVKFYGTKQRDDLWQLGNASAGYLLGWSFKLYSGSPYRKLYYNDYWSDWINYDSTNDGTLRMPAYSKTDLRAGLTFNSGGRTFALTADCFNVFNDRSVTSVNTIYGDDDGEGVYLNSDGEPLFGQPLSYQSPRTFRIGMRGEF